MKNKALSAMALGCILTLGGCDVLDTKDLSNYSPDNVWNDVKLADAYLTDLYAHTLGGWPMNEGLYADEIKGILGKEAIQANAGGFKPWGYNVIRNINVMIEGLQDGKLTEDQRKPLLGQAYFLRAFHYFNMLKIYGGIPLIDHVQTNDEELKVKRNTSAECFEFIIKDLDAAAGLLPDKYRGADYGRVDKCAVLAFKGRVLLFKASPQFNPTNPYGNPYIEEAYNATKTAKEYLEAKGFGLVKKYNDVFVTEGHEEAVLPVVFTAPSKTSVKDQATRPLSESKDATGSDEPIFDFAEAFPMKDGKKIGQSEKYSYDIQTYWQNRDPRFYDILAYNGCVYELSGKKGRRQYTVLGVAADEDACGFHSNANFRRTGLYCKKGLRIELPQAKVSESDCDWLEIRFAEVLFNYAEMANEHGDIDAAYDVLKQIRKRAGIEAGADGLYGLESGMSKEAMRTALIDERRIEFSFEGQRFSDLRRCRMLYTLNGKPKFGIMATVDPAMGLDKAIELASKNMLLPEDCVYRKFNMSEHNPTAESEMVLPDKYYFFPIPKAQIELNDQLEQNADWGGTFNPAL